MPSDQTIATVDAPLALGKPVMGELMAREGFIDKMADTIEQALEATVSVWDKDTKSYDVRPDYRTRMDAWKAAMAYGEGLPLQRIMAATVEKGKAGESLAKQMAESPAFIEYVERELAKAKEGMRFSRAQRVEKTSVTVAAS